MRLHHNKEDFYELIIATSEFLKIPTDQIEKDYYVCFLLKHLLMEIPDFIFRGGTSLSKCYKVIHRFSEDIDIHYGINKIPNNSQRKLFKEQIIRAINNAKLSLINEEQIKSRRNHNEYEIEFRKVIEDRHTTKDHLIIETYVPIKVYPSEKKEITSYIYEYLLTQYNGQAFINHYELYPFSLNVQHIHRTFIDKLFAVCDYVEQSKIKYNSRHLYDLYKIYLKEKGNLNVEYFQELFIDVKKERQRNVDLNISAKDDYDLKKSVENILVQDYYKSDYNNVTSHLLFEKVSYEEVKENLLKMLNSNLVPT